MIDDGALVSDEQIEFLGLVSLSSCFDFVGQVTNSMHFCFFYYYSISNSKNTLKMIDDGALVSGDGIKFLGLVHNFSQ